MATRTVNDHHALGDRLRRIDGRSYGAYREIEGRWVFPQFTLVIDHVQSDPFAPPSRLRALVPGRVAAFPPETLRPGDVLIKSSTRLMTSTLIHICRLLMA